MNATLTLATLEANTRNPAAVALTLHFKGKATEEQVKEVCRTQRDAKLPLWVDTEDEYFSVEEVRKGVWQAHPTG